MERPSGQLSNWSFIIVPDSTVIRSVGLRCHEGLHDRSHASVSSTWPASPIVYRAGNAGDERRRDENIVWHSVASGGGV